MTTNNSLKLLLLILLSGCYQAVTPIKVVESPKTQVSLIKNSSEKKIQNKVASVEISHRNITLEVNKRLNLTATVNIDSGEKNSAVIWVSSDNSIVSVDSTGTINALKKGDVQIKAVSSQDKSVFADCLVSVVDSESDKPSLVQITSSSSENSLMSGSNLKLNGIVKYVNGSFDANLIWKSSDETIATVSSDGVVKGLKGGTVTITAISPLNNGVFANLELQIIKKIEPSSPPPTVQKSPEPDPYDLALYGDSEDKIVGTDRKGIYVISGDGRFKDYVISGSIFESASLSLNQNKIIYMKNYGDLFSISVVDVDGKNNKTLTGIDWNAYPHLSADGTYAIFEGPPFRNTSTTVMATDTFIEKPPAIPDTKGCSTGSINPVDSRIAYTCNQDSLWVMSFDGQNKEKLLSATRLSTPKWSPSGDKIAYLQISDEGQDIYLYDFSTKSNINLTESLSNVDFYGSGWSKNGQLFYFWHRGQPKVMKIL